MTGRTHDLAAFTAMNIVLVSTPLQELTLATALVAFSMNMIGGLAPDLDQPTSSVYKKIRAGTILGKILYPLFGGHRFISHSILGIILFGFVLDFLLTMISGVLLVDMNIVWWAFMIGFISHLIMDLFTKDGIPLLFPLPVRFGFPPFRFLRMQTGGLMEKTFIFPSLILLNGYIVYTHYGLLLAFIQSYIK